jgi:hypothetical protein
MRSKVSKDATDTLRHYRRPVIDSTRSWRPYGTNDTPTNTTCESIPGLMRPRLALEM